jgi:pyruvate kinase
VNRKSDLPGSFEKTWKVPEVMATVGPTLEKLEDLRRAIQAGASWFRLPCGYRQRPHLENARTIRVAAYEVRSPAQLLLDLPSSRPRTGTMPELRLAINERVLFWDPELDPEAPLQDGATPVPLPGLAALCLKLRPKHRLWFCDGRLSFVVDELGDNSVLARLDQGTIPLKSSNSIFLPDSASPFSTMTPQDRDLLGALAAEAIKPDWIALSLISSPEDVRAARLEVRELLKSEVKIMAKFETRTAVECAADIIKDADGVMVARGDLGLAVGYIELPGVQEQLVAATRKAGKPVVVATQILEVFAETGLPQRAELSDLSLIARQRADVIMLGKETVFSPRPIECIRFSRELLTHETRRFEKAARLAAEEVPGAQAVAFP